MKLVRPAAAVSLAAALATAGSLLTACSNTPTAQDVASHYLADWSKRDWSAMRAVVASPPANFTSVNTNALTDISAQHVGYQGGHLVVSGSTAHEPVTQHVQITGVGTVTIKSQLRLVQRSGRWLVSWSPSTLATPMKVGDRLALQVTWAPRAQILGAGGAPLTTQAPQVIIGIEGQRIKKASDVRSALVEAGATKNQVSTALAGAKAHPTWFEPVFTVPLRRYHQLQPAIYPIPGTVFQTIHERTPATPGLGYTVGTVGPITAEELKSLGAPYSAASVVGQTGLELEYERQLAGKPGAVVTVVSADGTSVATIARVNPTPGKSVQTSIDPRVQAAAERAFATVKKKAAIVAVNADTGQVLASVSVPASAGFNLALDGAFPPGSSFKIITSTALIERGLQPSAAARCPATVTVDGEAFHNAEGTAPIRDFLHAFAESCNTAFIGLTTQHLKPTDFTTTAGLYRIGKSLQLGLTSYSGSVPLPKDEADLAATAIGQGRVLVSPLNMAIVAAAVDSGEVRAAQLVNGAGDDLVAPGKLPHGVVSDLHQLMRQVVLTGTASNKGLPPGTYAKTGTAQYGSGNPLPTDAWLVGFNGNIAFAMVTVNGGEGGPTDGPIVAKFLKLLHQSGAP